MTEADDALSRLFRAPLTTDRDEVFAARVARDVATMRRVQWVYRTVIGLAAIVIVTGLALSASAIIAALAPAMTGMVLAARQTVSSGAITLMAVTAVIAILATQWMARRSG
jgi:anti-sigma factor RsiW